MIGTIVSMCKILNYVSYWLTPWITVFLEKLTVSQPVKKFPAFMEHERFITAFTNARHPSPSSTRLIQSMSSHPTSLISILILSPIYVCVLQVVSFPQVSPPKQCTQFSSPHTCYMPRPFNSSRFDHPKNI